MTKAEQKRMRSLENKIAYRTKVLASMEETNARAVEGALARATTDRGRAHAEKLRYERANQLESKRQEWLVPLQEELASLMDKMLAEDAEPALDN